eukprot:TRINITY_DN3859_c0_g1_i9.p1 TRINITY_DN3859_c0_g1~~TRINITY_DN3859_c0_g1_i9.p1  ORF type:complete len:276 (+),score=71.88 TRINITY_DN3859_c0_g1_i9:199-1026(+)
MITEEDFVKFDSTNKVISIKDLSIGWDRFVYLFETANNKYILKKSKDAPEALSTEVHARAMITDASIPFARTFFYDGALLVEEYVEGRHMTQDEPSCVYRELGASVGKLHEIGGTGFGPLEAPGKGRYSTEKEAAENYLDFDEPYFKENPVINTTDVKGIIEKHKHIFDSKESILIHDDLFNENIIVREGKLAAIIDFADAMMGAREQELGLYYFACGKDEVWESFLEGYAKDFDHDKCRLYAFMCGTSLVGENYIKPDTLNHERYLKLLKEMLE